MHLRSGNFYTAVTMTTTTTTTTSTSAASAPFMSPTIKLLKHDTTIPKFSGEADDKYSPAQFLQLCEDVLSNSQIHSGADKICFIRSNLVPGSLACDLMSATAFDPKVLNNDYDQFKANFLQIFGVPQPQDNFQWAFDAAQTLSHQFGNVDYRRAQARSAQLANQAISSLKTSSWITNGSIDEASFRLIMEFQYYIQLLTPEERHVASTIQFSKGESILNFSSKLAVKLRSQQPAYVAAAASDSLASTNVVSSPPQQSFTPVVCQYCHKTGHTLQKCFLKQRTERQAQSRPSGPSGKSPSRGDHDFRSRPLSRDHKPQRYRSWSRGSHADASKVALLPPPYYCMIHGNCSHPTVECRTILKLQKDQTVTSQPNFPQAPFHRHKD